MLRMISINDRAPTDLQLKQMIACQDMDEFLLDVLSEEERLELVRSIRARRTFMRNTKRGNVAHALVKALTDSVEPIGALWLLLSTIELAVFGVMVLPITIFALVISFFLFGYIIRNANHAHQLKEKELEQFVELADVHYAATQELIRRKIAAIKELQKDYVKYDALLQDEPYQEVTASKKELTTGPSLKAAGAAFLSISLTGLAMGSILEMIGYISLTAFLGSTLGIGIVVGVLVVAICVAAYVGYKHYNECKEELLVDAAKKDITDTLAEQNKIYTKLKNKLFKLEHGLTKKKDPDKESELVKSAQDVATVTSTPERDPEGTSYLFAFY